MRKIIGLLVLSVVAAVMFNSCKKNFDNEQYTQTNTPVIPDLTSQITTSVAGFITNENDSAVSGAVITAGTQTATTNQFGYFNISNVSLSKTAAFVTVTYTGYFNGYRTFIAQPGKQSFIRLKLIPKTAIGTINAATGGTATTSDGALVTLPANAVVLESNNTSYTGTIHVAAHWINPADTINLPLNMPGNLLGIDTSGYLKILETFGMLAVELTDGSGNLLQIAPGKQATLSFPIPSALTASAPVSLPLWSFNDSTGLWKQESSATKTGSNYIGNVSHFSYWNCDIGMPLVNFTTQIVDDSLHPLANIPVSISISGDPNSARVSYTDTSGFIYGMVPQNANLQLDVLAPCDASVYSKDFSTTNSNVDLGTLIINLGQNLINITGRIVDCNNNPITNGIVFIAGNIGGNNDIAYVNNGVFNFNSLNCLNTVLSIVAIDSGTDEQSFPQTIALVQGNNKLGTISVCNTSQDEYIVYSINGSAPVTVTTLSGSAGYLPYPGPDQTVIEIKDTTNNLNILGLGILGDSIGVFSVSNQYLDDGLTTPQDSYSTEGKSSFQVTITEYGPVGGYISGNFNTSYGLYDEDNAVPETPATVVCSFRVKRTE